MCIPHKSPSNIWKQWLGPLVTSLFCSPNSPTYWSALHNNLFLFLVTLSLSSWGCLHLFLNSVLCRSKHISSEVQTKLSWNEILPASFFDNLSLDAYFLFKLFLPKSQSLFFCWCSMYNLKPFSWALRPSPIAHCYAH